jgi:hypothetical protein
VSPLTAQQLVRGAWPPDDDGCEWGYRLSPRRHVAGEAVGCLRAFLVAVAWFEVDRRRPQLRGLTPRETAALVCDAAEVALTAVVDRLSAYRGQSRFATWTAKFAIHEIAHACRLANKGVRTADQGATNELWAVGEAKERPEGWG